MKVAVLGCGPTGLVAAHMAMLCGADVDIYSKPRKSRMYGAQYLHAPIPATDAGEPVEIRYQLIGDIDGYRRKVYGSEYVGRVSPIDYEGNHPAYDIRRAYDWLWDAYGDTVIPSESIEPAWVVGSLPSDYDHVFSSIPAPALCAKRELHEFAFQQVYALGDSDKQMVGVDIPPDTVICNGMDEPSWYRASNIWGWRTVEWSTESTDRPAKAAGVRKPLSTTCDCFPSLTRVGRYGKWRKGVLVHDVIEDVLSAIG